ncbi:MAG: hypothetical protein HY038_10310 [Nitrospirae bacterium]|nr:hypothetical protein [Nitrospirota bacterium]
MISLLYRMVFAVAWMSAVSRAQSPYERGVYPSGMSQRDVQRDHMECEYKARLAND